MFQATVCPSLGETAVFMRHSVLVILCGWLFGMQGGMKFSLHPAYQAPDSFKNFYVSLTQGISVFDVDIRARSYSFFF